MPGLNWIPVVSQLKSAFQLVTGDVEGARQTQEDFVRECPLVSQGVALGQLMAGDKKGAEETFKRGIGTINNVANGIPIVGHVKGSVHLICGDTKGASHAFQSATRSTVVMGTGILTGVMTGGVGAIPAAIVAGTSYDTVDSIISDRPKGVLAAVEQVAKNPNAGNIFDATAMIPGDGLSGYSGAKLGQQIAAKVKLNNLKNAQSAKISEANVKFQQKVDAQIELNNLEAARVAKAELLTDSLGEGKGGMTGGQALELGNEINSITKQIDNLQTTQIEFTKGGELVQMEVPGRIDVLNSEISALANEAQALNQNIAAVKPQAGGVVKGTPNLTVCKEEGKTISTTSKYDDNQNYYSDQELVGDKQAVQADRYETAIETALSEQQRNAIARAYHEQQSKVNSIKKNDSKTHWSDQKWKNLKNKLRDSEDNDPQRPNLSEEEEAYLVRAIYEEVPLPRDQFSYTGAVMMNRNTQGVLHSFARHFDQWESYIPGLSSMISQLPESVRDALNAIRRVSRQEAANYNHMQKLYKNLNKAIKSSIKSEARVLLAKIQIKLLKFLRQGVLGEYIGEFVYEGGVRLLFRVRDLMGNRCVMAVAMSSQLDQQHGCFGGRPFRSIITVFFMTEEEVNQSENVIRQKQKKK